MQKKDNSKSPNEKFELADILKNGTVFKEMARAVKSGQYKSSYNRKLYNKVKEMLGDDRVESQTISLWFKNPEKYVTKAFTTGKRKDIPRWHRITNIMRFALEQNLAEATHKAQIGRDFYDSEYNRFAPLVTEFINPQNQPENEKS